MAQNQKIISDYSSLSTAKRGAKRKFGDVGDHSRDHQTRKRPLCVGRESAKTQTRT
jgi:hypothetical protein